MSQVTLSDFVEETAANFGVPGVAVGVWVDSQESYACHGVTSVDNPLPVDQHTLYVLGSVTKTYTATALMRLVSDGRVELEAPVRRYIPELHLKDEQAAAEVTVLQLLNHTAGLEWRMSVDTGEGDDALAAYVAKMVESELIAPPGTRTSYSQVGYNLAGRIIEKVTGLTYERAIAALIFKPLGLMHSFFAPNNVMLRRFAVGHNHSQDGALSVVQQWNDTRSNRPGGGLASSVADQLRWARFHLGDGRVESGVRVLPAAVLQQMKEPTAALQASSLGDAIGIGWFLRDVGGVRTVGHGGSANGQFAELLTVPERNFAVVALSNAGPDGGLAFNHAIVAWVLEHYLDVVERDPEPLPYDAARASEVAGSYENEMMIVAINTGEAKLTIECQIKPALRAASDKQLPPDLPPADLGLLPGDGDEYIVTSGGLKGQRGFFTRNNSGTVTGVGLAGRLFNRIQE